MLLIPGAHEENIELVDNIEQLHADGGEETLPAAIVSCHVK